MYKESLLIILEYWQPRFDVGFDVKVECQWQL